MAGNPSLRLSVTVENRIVGNGSGVNDPLELLRRDRCICFVAATLLCGWWRCCRAFGSDAFRPTINRLLGHLTVVLVGVLLALFWLAPMLSEYEYFVTRPNPVNLSSYFSLVLWSYCVVALIGVATWRRNPSPEMWPYLGGCGLLAGALVFSSTVAPEWFPLQAPRLLAILIFLLAVPAGYALAAALRGLARLLRELPGKDQAISLKRAPYTTGVALVLLLVAGFTSPGTKIQYSFYTPEEFSEITRILDFAKGGVTGAIWLRFLSSARLELEDQSDQFA